MNGQSSGGFNNDSVVLYKFNDSDLNNYKVKTSIISNGYNRSSPVSSPVNRVNRRRPKSTGLSIKERKSINIDSICHLNWMLIILIFTLINIYNFTYLDERCKEYKTTLIFFSRFISALAAIETTIFYLVWFFLTNSKYYYMQIVYDTITGSHITVAFLNVLFSLATFLARTCHEQKLTTEIDFRNQHDKIHLLALKYDLKIAAMGHLLFCVIIAFSAIHLTTKRSRFRLNSLNKRGLLVEYLWEVID